MKHFIRVSGRRLANFGQKFEKKDVDYRWEDPQSKSDAFLFLYQMIKKKKTYPRLYSLDVTGKFKVI